MRTSIKRFSLTQLLLTVSLVQYLIQTLRSSQNEGAARQKSDFKPPLMSYDPQVNDYVIWKTELGQVHEGWIYFKGEPPVHKKGLEKTGKLCYNRTWS
ncbi:MAG: hypothetical protein CM15mL3_1660 [Kanaloavirus sp.]|nr:MAG: hypothetical protein CM15mL3_1660 [Kanaloavirus sp.]